MLGDTIAGRYRLESRRAEPPAGRTVSYDALDLVSRAPVALHLTPLLQPLAAPTAHRLMQAARRLSTWRQPNVAPVLDAGLDPRYAYIATAPAPFETLAAAARRSGPREPAEVARLADEAAQAIEQAAAAGLHPASLDADELGIAPDGSFLWLPRDLTAWAEPAPPGAIASPAPPPLDLRPLGLGLVGLLVGGVPAVMAALTARIERARSVSDIRLRSFRRDLPAHLDVALSRALLGPAPDGFRDAAELRRCLSGTLPDSTRSRGHLAPVAAVGAVVVLTACLGAAVFAAARPLSVGLSPPGSEIVPAATVPAATATAPDGATVPTPVSLTSAAPPVERPTTTPRPTVATPTATGPSLTGGQGMERLARVTAADGAQLRREPKADNTSPLLLMPARQIVQVLDSVSGQEAQAGGGTQWYHVRVVPTGEVGFVYRPLVTLMAPDATALADAPTVTPAAELAAASPTATGTAAGPAARTGSAAADPEIEAWLAKMSLRDKVGQLLMIGFGGTSANPAAPLIRAYQPGSIVFWQNTASPAQTAKLTGDLQALAAQAGAGIPLFISIDHEGGQVQRLRQGVAYFPSKLVLGATYDPDLARLEGEVEGQELAAMGINMNLGPVLDVDDEPANPIIGRYQRSLGSNPAQVARMGTAYIDGLQAQGVVAVAKHFPGHGSTRVDSHADLPELDHDRATLDRLELPPFVAAIPRVGAVMSAHILFPAIDPNWPASLSPAFIGGLLRRELGFGGLIMTDDTGGMAAITDRYAAGPAAVQAVRAGSDLVMVVGDADREQRAFSALVAAAEQGVIPAAQLDDSVRRILSAKKQFGLLPPAPPPSGLDQVGSPAHLDAVRRVAEGAITLLRRGSAPWPLPPGPGKTLVVSHDALPAGAAGGTRLGEQIKQRRPQTVEITFRTAGDNTGLRERILAQAVDAEAIVVATTDAGPWQQGLVEAIEARNLHPIVVGFGAPYEVARLPATITYLAAYSPRTELVDAAVRVLFGDLPASGRLPVAIPGVFAAGYSATGVGERP